MVCLGCEVSLFVSESIAISIIIPAYNAASTISEAIESVVRQTFSSWELLICDDASTDNTVEAIQSFKDPRIKLFVNETNLGPGKTRDILIRKATGQWVAVLDADDAYEPTRLEKFHQVAISYPSAIIFDEIMECHDTKNGLVPWRPVREPSLLMGEHNFNSKLGREISPAEWLRCQRTMMKWIAPTELIKSHNIRHPDVRFGEDLGFILRLLSATNTLLYYIPESLYLYRLSSDSLTASSGRFDTLLGVLNEAKKYSGFDRATLSALNDKADSVERRLVYQFFLTELARHNFLDAALQSIKFPWIVPEFIKRVFERIPYHLHRKRYDGTRRETT